MKKRDDNLNKLVSEVVFTDEEMDWIKNCVAHSNVSEVRHKVNGCKTGAVSLFRGDAALLKLENKAVEDAIKEMEND